MGLINDCSIHLTTAAFTLQSLHLLNNCLKKVYKMGHGHMRVYLTTSTTYDHSCRLNYGHVKDYLYSK